MRLFLPHLASTEALGRAMAQGVQRTKHIVPMLFEGALGSGKTTLIRAMVEALPGGKDAEVSSPSFTVCNMYPTIPETVHYDMYRLQNMGLDASYYEFLDEGNVLLLIEWAQYIPVTEWPDEWLLFRWHPCDEGRLVEITFRGAAAEELLIAAALHTCMQGR